MDQQNIEKNFRAFARPEQILSWKPFGNGYINDTYLIQTYGNERDYILQRKNHLVFKDVPGMMNNIVLATDHIRNQLVAKGINEVDRKVMTYYPAVDGSYYWKDETENFWTLFLYIKDCVSVEEVIHPDQAESAGKAFGQFQSQLSDLQADQLIETIPNFHNGIFRLRQFQQAIENNIAGRLTSISTEIQKLMERSEEMVQLQQWLDDRKLPLRITHNDTKINNVLFDQHNQILCVIDLDTVMPGTVLFDFGDAIRTLGNSAAEDERDLEKIHFQHNYFEAYAKGYLSATKDFLTSFEKNNLAFSCRYMVWEQAVRFLIDYINGDTYYKIAYPEHNLVRTLSQIRYLEVLEENEKFMKEVVLNT